MFLTVGCSDRNNTPKIAFAETKEKNLYSESFLLFFLRQKSSVMWYSKVFIRKNVTMTKKKLKNKPGKRDTLEVLDRSINVAIKLPTIKNKFLIG